MTQAVSLGRRSRPSQVVSLYLDVYNIRTLFSLPIDWLWSTTTPKPGCGTKSLKTPQQHGLKKLKAPQEPKSVQC
jgi:hypothetical protein